MLVLTRKPDETVVIDGSIRITILEVKGNQVRLGIDAPQSAKIYREEVLRKIKEENLKAAAWDMAKMEVSMHQLSPARGEQ